MCVSTPLLSSFDFDVLSVEKTQINSIGIFQILKRGPLEKDQWNWNVGPSDVNPSS